MGVRFQFPEGVVTSSYEVSDIGAGNETHVFRRSSICS